MWHRPRSHGGVRSHRRMLHRGVECRRSGPRHCRCAHVWRRRGGSGNRRRRCGSRGGCAISSGVLCGGVNASGDQKGAANSDDNGKRKSKLLGKHGAKLPLLHLPHIKNARVRETIRCPAPLYSSPRRCSFKPDDRGSFKPDDRALACVERTQARSRRVESHHDFISLFEHDLRANAFSRLLAKGKPVSTLR